VGLSASKRPVVLIIEGEFLLRMEAVEMIEAACFQVVEAGNADQAIEILESRPDITVVFTDVQMPRSMDGTPGAGVAGRRSRSSQPPVDPMWGSGTCPKAGGFCPSPIVRDR
jgi:CheY-like chemotaxis protein